MSNASRRATNWLYEYGSLRAAPNIPVTRASVPTSSSHSELLPESGWSSSGVAGLGYVVPFFFFVTLGGGGGGMTGACVWHG
jgi:hypothetical protein